MPTVSMVFSTIDADFPEIQKSFKNHGIDMIGCSSAGEIHNDKVLEDSIVCLLLDVDKTAYRVFASESDDDITYQTAFEAGQLAKNTFENPGILLLSGGIRVDAEKLVYGVKDGVGREIPFFGGLAGDNLQLKETCVFSNDLVTTNGIACLILDAEKIEMTGMATSGWEAIGAENLITAAEGNVLFSINKEPALDVFLKHFGFFDNTSHGDEPITTLSAQYPLQLVRDGGVTVLRSPLFSDNENRSLILAGGVKVGERFRFSIAPGFEVTEKTVSEFESLRQSTPQADAVILFSCKGRHSALGPVIDEEIEGLYQHWNKPMIGFFSYGEIGNTKSGICEFHNETCSLVLLREKFSA